MRKRLFWKLLGVIAVSTVLMFWLIDLIVSHTEDSMSYIDQEYRNELRSYAATAEHMMNTQGEDVLADWIRDLEEREDTWVAIAKPEIQTFAQTELSDHYKSVFTLARSVDWKIHLYFKQNPTMDIPFSDGETRFLIQLPQRMRPGSNLLIVDLLLQIALPFLILCFISYFLYQQVMRPLKQLEQATKLFSDGDFSVRANKDLTNKPDELTQLAVTFDRMAVRISTLIVDQRQLLADLSHELRTPLTRLGIAVDSVEQDIDKQQALQRLRYESANMQGLIDDALTLAWFNTESPSLSKEELDIADLLHVIIEDARFEFPEHSLILQIPDSELIIQTAQQALAAAIENIIRNSLTHTPIGRCVTVHLRQTATEFVLTVEDEGRGVPEQHLEDIFMPFFRVNQTKHDSACVSSTKTGYGLGLALAKRQILALGGNIQAKNRYDDQRNCMGLTMLITLPTQPSPEG